MCSGSAGGILTPISSLNLNALGNLPAAKGVDAEQSALENGLTLVLKNIEFRLLDSDGATSAILEAHRSTAGDTSLREHLLAGVSAGLSCAEAIVASANHFAKSFPFQQQLPARTCPGRTRRLLPVTPANLR